MADDARYFTLMVIIAPVLAPAAFGPPHGLLLYVDNDAMVEIFRARAIVNFGSYSFPLRGVNYLWILCM